MLGKPEWFTRRKWGGWGLCPATKEGWVYLAVFVAVIFATQFMFTDEKSRMLALGVVAAVLILDTVDIMFRMKKDERETLHEALAERNALWVIITVLAVGIGYQTAVSIAQTGTATIDPVIIIAIVAGLIAKAATNYYLDKKD
ncbi:MAG: hypothetical protein UY50_C0022G0028 [Parcubacteria group bacterium GW2011_GWA2_49_9]|nr:MAG: hypothetical protein UY50_C0022G0028 [Parcubacteria group bacterium GW2011_GWA2_49_9]